MIVIPIAAALHRVLVESRQKVQSRVVISVCLETVSSTLQLRDIRRVYLEQVTYALSTCNIAFIDERLDSFFLMV